jgi:hypothetical protein
MAKTPESWWTLSPWLRQFNRIQPAADYHLLLICEEDFMAKNEKTSKRAGSAASKVMRNRNTSKNSKTAAASALTQRPDKKRKRKK